MKCFKCNRSTQTGFTMFGQDAEGMPGVWACFEHNEVIIEPFNEDEIPTIEPDQPNI